MPKVNDQYFKKKRNQILDAAFAVCMRKPVYNVFMKDVVIESGLSQGGVYKYFANIDDVLIALINRSNASLTIKADVDLIISSGKTPEFILFEIFEIINTYISSSLSSYGKIFFELDTIFANEPERFKNARAKIEDVSTLEYLMQKTNTYIEQKVTDGSFKPVLPLQDIFMLIDTSLSGIVHDVTLSKCYHTDKGKSNMHEVDERNLIKTLFTSIILLLGGNI